jgi:hypothetical protein
MNSIDWSMIEETRFSRSMLMAPTPPVPSMLIGQGTPPTSQLGWGFLRTWSVSPAASGDDDLSWATLGRSAG